MRATLGAAVVSALSVLLVLPHAASASLIYDSSIAVSGQGFGNVPRDLTIQATGQNKTGTESGCVSGVGGVFAGGPTSCISDVSVHDGNSHSNVGGDEVNPLADNQKFGIPTLGSLGITDPSQIRILFNVDEPSGDSANVVDLTLKFYNGNGLVAAIDGSQNFASTDPGNGKAGFVFVVDSAERTWLSNNVFNLLNFGDFNLALEATISDIAGGPESFVILAADPTTFSVPEPGTLPLFAVGILGVWLALRQRRSRHA
jgi:hypothetical protein